MCQEPATMSSEVVNARLDNAFGPQDKQQQAHSMEYVQIPTSASAVVPESPTLPDSSQQQTRRVPRTRLQSFPPASSSSAPAAANSSSKTTSKLSTNVSDLLLSSLLPASLPKLPTPPGKDSENKGRPRELSTQKEALSLPVVSYNFRRFVTRVGPIFWLQDRVEEVLYWRKPTWTWAWIVAWCFISFYPRLLLLAPSATVILLLLHLHEKAHPSLPSILGITSTTGSAPITTREKDVTLTSNVDGELPAVPLQTAESSVDYYMNLQAIQNLMGLIADIHDAALPYIPLLSSLQSTPQVAPSPTSLPVSPSIILLVLLPPTVALPLLPAAFMPLLILPLGIVPPLLCHPTLLPMLFAIPRSRPMLSMRAKVERWLMTDALNDEVARCEIREVEVMENERLDPATASTSTATTTTSGANNSSSLPATAWGSRFLRGGERPGWVKVTTLPNGSESLWRTAISPVVEQGSEGQKEDQQALALALKNGWAFIEGEEWKVDLCGDWSGSAVDSDGWSYTDDSWTNPSAYPGADPELEKLNGDMPSSAAAALRGVAGGSKGVIARKVTRRRKWWRRVYQLPTVP